MHPAYYCIGGICYLLGRRKKRRNPPRGYARKGCPPGKHWVWAPTTPGVPHTVGGCVPDTPIHRRGEARQAWQAPAQVGYPFNFTSPRQSRGTSLPPGYPYNVTAAPHPGATGIAPRGPYLTSPQRGPQEPASCPDDQVLTQFPDGTWHCWYD